MPRESYLPDEVNRQFIPRPKSEQVKRDLSAEVFNLEQQLKEIEKQSTLNMRGVIKLTTELENRMDSSEKEYQALYEEMLVDVIKQTNTELSEARNLKALALGQELITKSIFLVYRLIQKYLSPLRDDNTADYDPHAKNIRIKGKIDFRRIFWEIAAEGESLQAETIHHEVIHHYQYRDQNAWLDILRREALLVGSAGVLLLRDSNIPVEETILAESQAFLGSKRYSSGPIDDFDIASTLYKSYKVPKSKHLQVHSALEDIRKLYALGISDETIAKLSVHDDWDAKNGVYKYLHGVVENLRKISGYNEKDMQSLLEIDSLKQRIFIEKLKRAAQKILLNRVEQDKKEQIT